MIISKKWITKELISLLKCTGWSAPLLFENPDRFSRFEARMISCSVGFLWSGIKRHFHVFSHILSHLFFLANFPKWFTKTCTCINILFSITYLNLSKDRPATDFFVLLYDKGWLLNLWTELDINSQSNSNIWASLRENLSAGFPTKGTSNQSPQLQRLARKLKFSLKQV